MRTHLIAAAAAMLSIAAQAGTLADLGAQLFAATGLKAPIPVLGPGVKLNVSKIPGEKVVAVYGEDKCPDKPEYGCTVLNKPAVKVHWADSTNQVTEHWTVVNTGGRTYLARPNGPLVSQAN